MSLPGAEIDAISGHETGAAPGHDRAEPPPTALWRDALRRLRADRGALVGALLILLFVAVAVFAPVIAPETPSSQTHLERLSGGCCPGPSSEHWFGLDDVGRDEFSLIVYGARTSLLIAVASVSVGLLVGLTLGALAGAGGRMADTLIMRIVDIMLAIPSLLFAIGLVALLGPGLWQLMIAIGVVNVPIFARLLRGSMLSVRQSDYVAAARSLGLHPLRVLFVHILPNALSPLIVAATLAMATAIVEAAGLGFLGLGNPDPSVPEWGAMLSNTPRFLASAPHLALFPGLAIIVAVLGFNLLGDGLREALDPRQR